MGENKVLRDNPIWKETYAIVEDIYSRIDKLIEEHPDEKWATASKLRNAASDSLYYVSQSVGNAVLETSGYDWNNARKHLFSLQTMYIFAAKQQLLAMDPELIVKIDNLFKQIDANIASSQATHENKGMGSI
jgi:hypothetical protein